MFKKDNNEQNSESNTNELLAKFVHAEELLASDSLDLDDDGSENRKENEDTEKEFKKNMNLDNHIDVAQSVPAGK